MLNWISTQDLYIVELKSIIKIVNNQDGTQTNYLNDNSRYTIVWKTNEHSYIDILTRTKYLDMTSAYIGPEFVNRKTPIITDKKYISVEELISKINKLNHKEESKSLKRLKNK